MQSKSKATAGPSRGSRGTRAAGRNSGRGAEFAGPGGFGPAAGRRGYASAGGAADPAGFGAAGFAELAGPPRGASAAAMARRGQRAGKC